MLTLMPLKVTVCPLTATTTAVLVDVAASQMLSPGTSLLLSHKQSPAGMALLLNDCGTICVAGDVPPGQAAAPHGSQMRAPYEALCHRTVSIYARMQPETLQ